MGVNAAGGSLKPGLFSELILVNRCKAQRSGWRKEHMS